jgi:hypothetical protein
MNREALDFLKVCYRFLHEEWGHATHELLPDQGFEERLRECCVGKLKGWRISQPWELQLGGDLETSSGTNHEIDIVAEFGTTLTILEAKNRPQNIPTKNDVIVFLAKILDYLTCNSSLTLKEICPVFISTSGFDRGGLAACFGLGIHPVGPEIRPLPVMAGSLRWMENELRQGIVIGQSSQSLFDDFRARVNRYSTILEPTWFSSRYGFLSEDTITVKVARGIDTLSLSNEYRLLNSQCTQLITEFKRIKEGM